MKKQHRLISLILVLSLLFSSFVFTANAQGITNNEFSDEEYVSAPSADYEKLEDTSASKNALTGMLKSPYSAGYVGSPQHMYGGNNVDTYIVHANEGNNDNSYVMVVPTESAKANGYTPNNFYIPTNSGGFTVTYQDPNSAGYVPTYFVFEYDVATESTLFPLQVWLNSRYWVDENNTTYIGGVSFDPLNVNDCLNLAPGVFYHMTLVYDINANLAYVYLNDTLVQTITNGVINNSTKWNDFVNGERILIDGIRMELNHEKSQNVVKKLGSLEDLSICLDNFTNRGFKDDAALELAKYAGRDTLDGWKDNIIEHSNVRANGGAYKYLPSLITVNDVKYNNTKEANAALDTIKLDNKAALIRDCLSSRIVVNSDTTLSTVLSEATIVAGPDVDLEKINTTTWVATLKEGVFKYSASVIPEMENARNIEKYISYFANDNIITAIEQIPAINERTFTAAQFEDLTNDLLKVYYPTLSDSEREANRSSFETKLKALFTYNSANSTYTISNSTINNNSTSEILALFRKASVTGNIMHTDGGNDYLIINDATGSKDDFPLNVHYQVNATMPYRNDMSAYKLSGHDYIVFEQDIHSESSFINIYNNFNLRTPDDASLSVVQVFANNISISSEKWYHLTYVGDIANGNSYLFLDGECIAKIEGGLYDTGALFQMLILCDAYTPEDGKTKNDYSTAQQKEIINSLPADEVARCVGEMVLGGFRTMQVAGENKSGESLTPDMSAASDNYYLRWVDGESSLADEKKLSTLLAQIDADYSEDKTINGKYSIEAWGNNVYNDYYKENVLPEKAVIATINGVDYFDTESISNELNADYTDTKLRNVVFYREYIGTITVKCYANITFNGITSTVVVDHSCTTELSSDGNVLKVTPVAPTVYDNPTSAQVLAAIKNPNNSNNLYNSHSYTGSGNKTQVIYDNFTDVSTSYLLERGSSTHTLGVNSTSVLPSFTNTSPRGSSNWTSYTITYTATNTEFYVITEFDLAFSAMSDSSDSYLKLSSVFSNTALITGEYDLKALVGNSYNVGDYVHVTMISHLYVSTDITHDVTISGNNWSKTVSASISYSSYVYTAEEKIYVDDTLVANGESSTTASRTALSSINWTGAKLENKGNEILVDNVKMSKESDQTTHSVSLSYQASSYNENVNTSATNFETTCEEKAGTSETLKNNYEQIQDESEIHENFASSTLTGSYASGGASYDGTYNPPVDNIDSILENSVGYINGTGYTTYAALLEAINAHTGTDFIDVTLVKAPDSATTLTVGANAIIHTSAINGSNLVIKAGTSTVGGQNYTCITRSENGATRIIVLEHTEILANYKGVDYTDETTLKNVFGFADDEDISGNDVHLTFYKTPETPFNVTRAIRVETNGLADLYTFSDYSIHVEKNGSVHTLEAETRTGTINVTLRSSSTVLETHTFENVPYGTNIQEFLTEEDLIKTTFVVGNAVYTVTGWSSSPTGYVYSDGESATHSYTIYVSDQSVTVSAMYAYVSNGQVTESNSESDVRSWFAASGIGTIILNADILFTNDVHGNINLYGTKKDVYLNGHSISFKSMKGGSSVSADHAWNLNSNVNVNFHGEGAINYTENWLTQAVFFCGYDFTGKISLENVTVNTTSYLAIVRGGHLELNNCTVDAYMSSANALFFLGEQYNGSYTKNPISLNLRNTDISLRHKSSNDISVIRNLVVTYTGNPVSGNYYVGTALERDVDRTVIVDGCKIVSQGAFVRSNEGANWNTMSGLRAYINDTDIIAKNLVYGNAIQTGTILLHDNVRVSDDNTDGLAFATHLVAAKTSDGIYKVLYTSTQYTEIKWSNGETELWATGSTPTNPDCKNDYITIGGIGANQSSTSYDPTTGYPFSLLTNLTLSDVIGFNIYIPNTLKNGTAVNPEDVLVYMDGKLISANCYVDTETVRESYVYLAKEKGFGDGYCYDYTCAFKPQDAAKTFTLVIVYKNTSVMSRTISVGDYIEALANTSLSQKNKELLQVAVAYIEQAAIYSGSSVSLSKITAVKNKLGTLTVAPTAPTLPDVTHEGTASDLKNYISGAQINVKGSCAFKFNLIDGANASNFKFYVVNDAGDGYVQLGTSNVKVGEGYIELSLRAYEMARSIKIEYTDGGTTYYRLYSLYEYYTGLNTLISGETVTIKVNGTDTVYTTGNGNTLTAAKDLVATLYSYASICDKHLNRNVSEYEQN